MVFLQPVCVSAQDTLATRPLTKPADTLHSADSIRNTKKNKNKLTDKVEYASKDSLRFEIKNQKVYLYQDADIKYKDISLKANYVEIDFPKNIVNATYTTDSTGKMQGVPEFTESSQKFKSKIISYNYTTKQGYIQSVFTKQDEGYLHGTIVKKMENDITYIRDGSYTTCDLEENPHFEFRFGKGKVIPGKRVITGPAEMAIAQVPTPLMIPFGFFPNKVGRRSGIRIPGWNEFATKGFALTGGGYYWAIGEYADFDLIGDIYSHGDWALHPKIRYNYRYHYNGQLTLGYSHTRNGDPHSPTFQKHNDFLVQWNHSQDSKARPHSTFSASVNIVSTSYNTNNLTSSAEAYLTNTYQSSINYATNWHEKYFLTLNFSHQQNTLTKTIDITLPQVQFYINQFYPFKRQKQVGKQRWYENISTRYTLDAENHYNTTDSTILNHGWLDSLQNGMRHTIPISGTFRILKYFNWTTSLNLTDAMYLKTIRKRFINETVIRGKDTINGYYENVTEYGFANAFNANASTGVNTTIYGMIQIKKGPIMAFRHVLKPSVSYVYTPNFGAPGWGYWRTIENDTSRIPGKYSIFEKTVYGGPGAAKSGIFNFALHNNLEMKVRNRKDTVTGTKKIVLIEDLAISSAYDMARDSVRWSKIAITGYTTLFKTLRINYNATLDPYAMNAKGQRINASEWKVNHRLLRLDNTSWSVDINYTLTSEKGKKNKDAPLASTKGTPEERKDVMDFYDAYVDFNIPWSFRIDYGFKYNKNWNSTYDRRIGTITQTLAVSGMINLTPKWKVTASTGYDFQMHALSYTRVDVYRDLHCWEMSFGWVPKGGQQQWDFHINVKAALLQELKLNKKKDYRDYVD